MSGCIFRQIQLHIEEKAQTEKAQEVSAQEATLFVTDDAATARRLAAEGQAVLGILTAENQSESFAGVRFLTEEFDESDTLYLERVYRRYAGLPWTVLETERLLVRESTGADVDAFYEIYKAPKVSRFMHDLAADRAEQIRYMEQYRENMYGFYEFGIWTVVLKATGEVIGRAGFAMREGFSEPELGFVIGVPWQRQGLAREACEAILQYGKEELQFSAVRAVTRADNAAAIALLRGLGFVYRENSEENPEVNGGKKSFCENIIFVHFLNNT